jgi:hypothetical protein
MTITELAILFRMRDETSLRRHLRRFEFELADLSSWFNNYLDKYSNSIMMHASYDSNLRQPYNEKYDQYEQSIELARVCKYYLEKL